MTRRDGITLIEVLVAIFIMGIGMIAILTLFPLGAMNMARAVRDDRSAQLAASADAFLRTYWKNNVVEPTNPTETFYLALDNPNAGNTNLANQRNQLPAASLNEASYPVLVDPMGWASRSASGSLQYWLGDQGFTVNVPRRSIDGPATWPIKNDPDLAFRVCSQWDGIGCDEFGKPTKDREVRYNWLAVLQRTNSKPKAAALTVVVFDRRFHLVAPKRGDEDVHTVTFTPGTTSVTIPGYPDMKASGWVMDATVNDARDAATNQSRPLIRHANFYRVVSAEFDGTNTKVELQTPIESTNEPNVNLQRQAYTGTLVLLRGVSGVYGRKPLAPDQ